MKDKRSPDASSLGAHPAKDKPWKERRQTRDLKPRREMHQREERGLYHEDLHVELGTEERAVRLPCIVQAGLHKAPKEGLLGERDHEQLPQHKRGEVAGCTQRKRMRWLMPEVEPHNERREDQGSKPQVQQLIRELAYRLTVQQRLEEAEQSQNCISDEEARTRFGRWLQG